MCTHRKQCLTNGLINCRLAAAKRTTCLAVSYLCRHSKKEELRRKQTMKVLVIGIGGNFTMFSNSVTNGGKTTLAEKLKKMLPNCDIISQDDFFKPESEVETDERGFKLYDVLDALYMDEMVTRIRNWIKSPASSGVATEESQSACDNLKNVYILIVEGFLLYNYEPLNELWNRRYFLTLPYEECKRRRSTRVYQPPDTPGYFDGHVWPMYLKYKNELEENASMQVDQHSTA
ncbi:nicotinamide riboside kinase 1 isoform X5 [Pithys albifrons albifrons]|uniref:nicotinamide riboside kinase 1 isoform X5 n=1 Tax=Pithys albifrons albifrons TaxID=3385563 RepID=UPI003A5CCB63